MMCFWHLALWLASCIITYFLFDFLIFTCCELAVLWNTLFPRLCLLYVFNLLKEGSFVLELSVISWKWAWTLRFHALPLGFLTEYLQVTGTFLLGTMFMNFTGLSSNKYMKVLTYSFKLFGSYTLCGMFAYPYKSKISNFSLCFVTCPGTLLEQVTSMALKYLFCWENSTSW